MPTTSVLLLRHGQSEWNVAGRWQGLADSPLTELGRRQARTTAAALVGVGAFDAIVTSHLRRAHATAAEIADRLGLDAPVVDERWGEADAGEWQGLTHHEIEDRWPGWLSSRRRPDSFETAASIERRAGAALADLAGRWPGRRVVVVTHSGVMRTLVRSAGVVDERIPNLGGVWLDVERLNSFTRSPTASVRIDRSPLELPVDSPDELPGDVRPLADRGGWRFVRRHEVTVGATGIDIHGEDPGDAADDTEDEHGSQG